MPPLFAISLLMVTVHQHTWFGSKEITITHAQNWADKHSKSFEALLTLSFSTAIQSFHMIL